MIPEKRICNICKISKPLEEFQNDKTGTYGKKARCADCCNKLNKERYPDKRRNRTDRLKRSYGITIEDVVRTLINQHGLCANRGCGKEISIEVKTGENRAVVDHCHRTGKFRAILCMSCNLELGKLEKNKNKILGLVEYLDKFKN